MIRFAISVQVSGHTRGEIVEDEDMPPEELARCTELAHEMLAYLERVARRRAEMRAEKERRA